MVVSRRTDFSPCLLTPTLQQLAMLAINPPTAALLLSEYVNLKSGDWVVQKLRENSSVGRWVIAFAKNARLEDGKLIVRRPEARDRAQGDRRRCRRSSILPDVSKQIKDAVGQAELRLALDGVSGPARPACLPRLSRCPAGTLVAYAA